MTAHQRYIEVAGALPAPAEGYFAPAHPGFYARHIKRPFDVLVVLLLAPIVVPLILLLMLLVSLDGMLRCFGRKGLVGTVTPIRYSNCARWFRTPRSICRSTWPRITRP